MIAPLVRTLPKDVEERWEYDANLFELYYAFAQPETPESMEAWTIMKYTYDVTTNLRVKTEVKRDVAWSNRATAGWD